MEEQKVWINKQEIQKLIPEFTLVPVICNTTDDQGDYYKEQLPDCVGGIRRRIARTCKLDTIKNRIPILIWLPKYKFRFLIDDFVAGITVGLTAIPQAIAYAAVANLQAHYGLYSAFMGCFMYILFGSCKDITVGPTAIMALMIQNHVKESADFSVLTCFLAGCIITVLGLLNLGFLVQFISTPVTTGFTIAAAITIASGQINSLFGVASQSNDFIWAWKNFFNNIQTVRLNDSILGVTTLIILLLLRKLKDIKGTFKYAGKYLSLSRNALVVVAGATIAFLLSTDTYTPFRLTGEVQLGLPPFQLPPFSTNINGTRLDFVEMLDVLGSSTITISLIAILESVAIAKAFSKGKTVDATQEMIALGICNIMGSFVQSMPVTGSFTRTAVNNASGVRTPLGGLFTGCLVLLSLRYLVTYFRYIPKATLAGIIICAMIFMVDYQKVIFIWKAKKSDIISFVATVAACLFLGLEYGILCGVVLSNFIVLFTSSRPKVEIVKEKLNRNEIVLVTLKQNLNFSSAEYVKEKIIKAVANNEGTIACVIVDGRGILNIDSTVAMNLLSIREDLKVLNCDLIFWNWTREAAGVLFRVNENNHGLFKNGATVEEVFYKYNQDKNITNHIEE